ncbi:uncharacterized protein BO87DRAFT_160545 [Aspergillus neoniger CBS 115656]|uniref:Uncharacterized protein n=1 Tax=Aspergillus neoniger (strain CBS 115656) TaxID=1448310 RepID=A0A318Y8E3_ASPNB|nr:hypothetical protein BO87DRAFT_160545 [Aspergillus neoniger CBS 115656]PYH30209.1 hypothetical protein BO87DRAFT_160545 [Aspergillus neoniger CBS 115656]
MTRFFRPSIPTHPPCLLAESDLLIAPRSHGLHETNVSLLIRLIMTPACNFRGSILVRRGLRGLYIGQIRNVNPNLVRIRRFLHSPELKQLCLVINPKLHTGSALAAAEVPDRATHRAKRAGAVPQPGVCVCLPTMDLPVVQRTAMVLTLVSDGGPDRVST